MRTVRLPVLTDDSSCTDWPQAKYQVDVLLGDDKATIKHKLSGSADLQTLVDNGDASWVTEVRCPRTLFSHKHKSSEPVQQIRLDYDTHLAGNVFMVPGMVLERSSRVATTNLNKFSWPRDSELDIPVGWWLIKGEVQSVTPLVASLVKFRRDKNKKLRAGQMSVSEDSEGDVPCFTVLMANDLFVRRHTERDIQIAGLIAACGMLPRSSLRQDGANADTQMAHQLRDRFEAAGVSLWDDDDFDPALAATTLESFHVPPEESEDE